MTSLSVTPRWIWSWPMRWWQGSNRNRCAAGSPPRRDPRLTMGSCHHRSHRVRPGDGADPLREFERVAASAAGGGADRRHQHHDRAVPHRGHRPVVNCTESTSPRLSFYSFHINGDGTHEIWRYHDAAAEPWNLLASGHSGDVKPTPQANHITVACIGPLLALAINGNVVVTIEDPMYADGTVALSQRRVLNEPRL